MITAPFVTGPVLSQLVRGLLADPARLAAMAAASRRLGRPQATRHVVDEIERLLGNASSGRGAGGEDGL